MASSGSYSTSHIAAPSRKWYWDVSWWISSWSGNTATINYEVYDEDCNTLIVKNKGIEEDINIIMSNSLGFGGHNVSLIARRYSDGI